MAPGEAGFDTNGEPFMIEVPAAAITMLPGR